MLGPSGNPSRRWTRPIFSSVKVWCRSATGQKCDYSAPAFTVISKNTTTRSNSRAKPDLCSGHMETADVPLSRSEERRVGKECRSRGSMYRDKEKGKMYTVTE